MGDNKKKYKVTEVKAASEIDVKPIDVEDFDGEAPDDEEEKARVIEENVIDEVGQDSSS